jgi:hypothetical protein
MVANSKILDNLNRLKGIYSDNAPKHDYIYFYCKDYEDFCRDHPAVHARAWSDKGFFRWWDNHFVQFCPSFYNSDPLDKVLSRFEGKTHAQKEMENFEDSRDSDMLHESCHWSPLVGQPQIVDHAQEAENSWKLARDQGTGKAYVNAASYALDATAIYVHQHFKG